jgi:hypothetical protein
MMVGALLVPRRLFGFKKGDGTVVDGKQMFDMPQVLN